MNQLLFLLGETSPLTQLIPLAERTAACSSVKLWAKTPFRIGFAVGGGVGVGVGLAVGGVGVTV